MATMVLMPQLGEAVEEATITKWLKAEGDIVQEFDALVEVNTDKVDTEIPAPVSGVLLKIVEPDEGSIIEVGKILAWIGQPGESLSKIDSAPSKGKMGGDQDVGESQGQAVSHQNEHSEPSDMDRSGKPGFISPIVAKIASENNVNLKEVQGTGLNQRITKKDILKFLQDINGSISQAETLSNGSMNSAKESEPTETLIPHSAIRRNIANHMVMSKRTSPHVTTVFETNLSKVVEHRSINKDTFSENGTKLTFTAYFVAATTAALRDYPMVNSSWSNEGVIIHQEINIGMATSLGAEGLIVPVIKNADELSLLGIARKVNDLSNRARSRQLLPNEVAGGTFTITNHGVSGSLLAMPIINQPQSAILGIGKIEKRVIVLEDNLGYDTISVRPMAYLTLTFDHRVLDGAIADYFLSKVVSTLENWT